MEEEEDKDDYEDEEDDIQEDGEPEGEELEEKKRNDKPVATEQFEVILKSKFSKSQDSDFSKFKYSILRKIKLIKN